MFSIKTQPANIVFSGDRLGYELETSGAQSELHYIAAQIFIKSPASGTEFSYAGIKEVKAFAPSVSFSLGTYLGTFFEAKQYPLCHAIAVSVNFTEYHGIEEEVLHQTTSPELTVFPGYLPLHYRSNGVSLFPNVHPSAYLVGPDELFTLSVFNNVENCQCNLEAVSASGGYVSKSYNLVSLSVLVLEHIPNNLIAGCIQINIQVLSGAVEVRRFSIQVVEKPQATVLLLFRSPQLIFKTLYCTGELEEQDHFKKEITANRTKCYIKDNYTGYKLNTGFITQAGILKLKELYLSEEVYWVTETGLIPIVLTNKKAEAISTKEKLYHDTLEFYTVQEKMNLADA